MNSVFASSSDAPDPGSGSTSPMKLKCRNCSWSTNGRAVTAVSAAIRHTQDTGHQVAYKGIVQDFGGVNV